MFIKNDDLVGNRVYIQTGYGEDELATIIAVSDTTDKVKVRTDDGDVLVGNQWDDA